MTSIENAWRDTEMDDRGRVVTHIDIWLANSELMNYGIVDTLDNKNFVPDRIEIGL